MRFLPVNNKIYLDRDGVTEIEGPGIQDKRNFLLTLFDPFDVVGLIRGRDKEEQFWQNHEGTGRKINTEGTRSEAAAQAT